MLTVVSESEADGASVLCSNNAWSLSWTVWWKSWMRNTGAFMEPWQNCKRSRRRDIRVFLCFQAKEVPQRGWQGPRLRNGPQQLLHPPPLPSSQQTRTKMKIENW